MSGGLLHAVAVGSFVLLGLKVVAIWAGPPVDKAQIARATPQALERAASADGAVFGRALFKARGLAVDDPEVTGSVEKKDKDAKAKEPATPPLPPGANKAGIFDGNQPMSPAEKALYERLGERRGELDQRANELETREKLLQGVEKKLESSIQDLKANEEKFAALQKKESAASQTLKNLVTMYESMKPKEAARVFDRLSHDVLVPVVLQMNPRKMAEVLAAMSPEAAEKLTVALASRGNGEPRPTGAALPPNELPALPR